MFLADKPSRPILTLNPQSVYRGRVVELTCDVTDLGNPKANYYTFYKGNDAFTTTDRSHIRRFIELFDEGMYSCKAMNSDQQLVSGMSEGSSLAVKGDLY